MQTYLVGGAVRDQLLGLPVKERDWVVVGGSVQQMLDQGFRKVGKDFPVFLHPVSGEEYALARTERKKGPGYYGFDVHAAADVTLEQDLLRRDLTINAIAQDENQLLTDPYGGQRDLEQRLLRHVSPAFSEDPLRVLRVARFLARLAPLGFRIAPETSQLMSDLAASGELENLVPERVWQETETALGEAQPQLYFQALRDCGALRHLFPELDALYGIPQPARWHPEVDTGLHSLMVLAQAAKLSDDPCVRFAALVHDLGKAATPRDLWPSHPGHERRSVQLILAMVQRLKIPNQYRDLAVKVAELHGKCHNIAELRDSTVLAMLEALDSFRRPRMLEDFLLACEADARGRTDREDEPYPQAELLRQAHQAAASVNAGDQDLAGLTGEQIGALLRQERLRAIARQRLASENSD
ncbi:MAG: multifunctional CCA addition/repair protein [Gammaproteobacteria bacterium]|jgi:tRNA nucleotidyltransferase (CCA-adding enzyme)|nr:multifunctional CCA addition/repair protein [Gammaproteobacteria bacterium]